MNANAAHDFDFEHDDCDCGGDVTALFSSISTFFVLSAYKKNTRAHMSRDLDGKLGASKRTWLAASTISLIAASTCWAALIGVVVVARGRGRPRKSLEDWMFPVGLCTLLSLGAVLFFAAGYNDTPPQPPATTLLRNMR